MEKKTDEILDLSKMAEQTAQAVKRLCLSKTSIPMGFSLLFFDPMATIEKRWNYTINLAGNPERDMDPEERKRLQACFEIIMEGVKRIYQEGVPETEIDDAYRAREGYHS